MTTDYKRARHRRTAEEQLPLRAVLVHRHRKRKARIRGDWKADGEALIIAPLAVTKALTEVNILRAMTAATDELGKITDEPAWRKIAQLHSSDAVLDERSISLIKRQNPELTDLELAELLQKFQGAIVLDTVRNEYLLHTKLYTWLVTEPVRDNVEKLNEQVYAKLFLTPGSDPWLGLFSTDVYTALDHGGVVKPR